MKPIDDEPSPDDLERLLREAAGLPDPPPALVRRAIDAFASRPLAPLQAAGATARRLVAVLGFDSWSGTPAVSGMRDLPSNLRQMVFTAQGRDVDLRIAPAGSGRFVVSGQVLGPDVAGSVVLVPVQASGVAARNSTLDSFGEFRIDDVTAGRWLVTLHAGDVEIELPEIEVGERAR